MQNHSYNQFLFGKRNTVIKLYSFLFLFFCSSHVIAQDKWTPEEHRELFGYCDKPELIKRIKINTEQADKIAEIDFWARQQQKTIDANTNEVYATAGELQQEVTKKYKAFLAADQVKGLVDYKKEKSGGAQSCSITILTVNHVFDTMPAPRAILQYKAKYRKPLIDKLGINGRQADGVFEIEVWKQKESVTISAIPETDFSRIRKTVAMYAERVRRFKVVGLSDEQIENAAIFFEQNKL